MCTFSFLLANVCLALPHVFSTFSIDVAEGTADEPLGVMQQRIEAMFRLPCLIYLLY